MSKVHLKLLVLCDFALISKEGKLSIIGLFDKIFTEKVPSRFLRFFVVAVFEGESSSEHAIEYRIFSKDGKDILPPKQVKIILGGNGRANMITDVVNFPLTSFGENTVEVRADGVKVGSETFGVVRIQKDSKQKNLPN